MKRIMPILLVAVIATACDGTFRARPFESSVCGERVAGYTATFVAYGDSHLVVIPLSTISVDTEWRFILRPTDISKADPGLPLREKLVTISGKDSPRDDWINVSGTYTGTSSDKHTLRLCVRPTVAADTYYYIVNVADVGQLDPRADVSP